MGKRLAIAAGTSIRFEPGIPLDVQLVDFGGARYMAGFRGEVRGPLPELSRSRYAALYGPTAGDRVRLADTDLFIEVTEDLCGGPGRAGDEAVFGGGKVVRESMGQGRATRAEGAPDLVVTGA